MALKNACVMEKGRRKYFWAVTAFKSRFWKYFQIITFLLLAAAPAWAHVPVFPTAHPAYFKTHELAFNFDGYQFEGDFLVFSYSVKFPGVTTLIMTDSDGEIIWRNEYLDEIAGYQKIALKKAKLISGETYVFKFEFKLDRVMKAVTIP